jgi:hypothetical protein
VPERVVRIASDISGLTREKLGSVAGVATATRMLAINASIEAAHAGPSGAGFGVVAKEIRAVADEVAALSAQLDTEMAPLVDELKKLGDLLVMQVRGTRLSDLALHVIELIDRNLYERSCDVRWWATDAAVVEACADPSPERVAHACDRLGVILSSYTVYLDLWIADADGRVVAHGRPDRYGGVIGRDVSGEEWFTQALQTPDGGEFAVVDVARVPALGDATVATYSTAVRAGADANGEVIGALGIFFDFAPQAHAIVTGAHLDPEERSRTRVLLVDRHGTVLAASDDRGQLTERIDLARGAGERAGVYRLEDGTMVGFSLTPGYETYEGLGWYGVITQTPPALDER